MLELTAPRVGPARALELVAAGVVVGHTDSEIARHMGVSVRTIYRRKSMDETQQLIVEARRDAARRIREGVVDGALAGLDRLHRVVTDPTSSDAAAVSAAKYMLDLAVGPGGLAALVDPLPAGHTCESCGHQAPDEAGRRIAVERIKAQLDEVRSNMIEGEAVAVCSAVNPCPCAGRRLERSIDSSGAPSDELHAQPRRSHELRVARQYEVPEH